MRHLPLIGGPDDLRRLPEHALPELADEIRELIVGTIGARGGHLGAGLGAVELAIALHYVFASPTDRLIWDVGHQAHAHKILTGRAARFHTIRSEGGLSGFLRRDESPHDLFGAGHASTSISAGLGIREGLRLKGALGKVVVVIGDAGLASGLAFEALNQLGALGRDLIIVLNDNGMSIRESVGALSQAFAAAPRRAGRTAPKRLQRLLARLASHAGRSLGAVPGKRGGSHGHRDGPRRAAPGDAEAFFRGLGLDYVGKIDGHNITELLDTLREARNRSRPTLLHVATEKGRGFAPAEASATRLHAVEPFALINGPTPAMAAPCSPATAHPTYTAVFAQTLADLAEHDPRVVGISAAMVDSTGLSVLESRFPQRVYDVGIAEEHAVTFAAGLAVEGFRPVVAIYSSFLQRAFDQIIHDVCLQNLPVLFCLDRSGLVGEDGPTHHGVFDVGFLRMIPNMMVMAPRDEAELRQMLALGLSHSGPSAIRFPRGPGIGVPVDGPVVALVAGEAEVLLDDGPELLLIGYGPVCHAALAAAEQLRASGTRCTVINGRFAKPLDETLLLPRLERASYVLTIEEGAAHAGFGSAVLELCARQGVLAQVGTLGIDDRFVAHGTAAEQRRQSGLDPSGIVAAFHVLRTREQHRGRVLKIV